MKRFRKAKNVPEFAARAQYDAAGTGRRIASWTPPASGPQSAIVGFERIRNRARDLARNDWAGQSSAQKWVTALVGVGIVPRWKADDLNAAWADHARTCDADGVLDFYGLQALGTRAWFISGEVFLRRRPRDLSLPLPAPVQYQLIEGDFVPNFDADQYPGLPAGNTIRQGIERNAYGRRVAYWMYRDHPGDRPSTGQPDPHRLVRVLARDVSHVFEPDRPGALRGVSPLANVMTRLRAAGSFEDAVLDKQLLSNLYVAFIKRTLPQKWEDLDFDPQTGLPKFYSEAGNPLVGLEPGILQTLAPGEEMQFANPPGPAATIGEYMRSTHQGTAAGTGLPYELLTGAIQDVSDRTLRVVINEFRRYAEQRQWHTIIPMLCQPMVNWWAEAMTLKSMSVRRLKEARTPEWSPHGWDYIHPVQDVEGKIKAIEAGLTSQSAEILKRGDDPRKVFEQRAADRALARELGIETPEPAAAQRNSDVQALQQIHASTLGFGAQLATAIAGRPVNVAAPTVHVTNTVPPAEVTANVVMPDRKHETEVERDAEGQILRSTTIETTLQ